MKTAIVTGASRGLGLALGQALAVRGWRIVVDARGGAALDEAWAGVPNVTAVAGNLADVRHRRAIVEAAGPRIDLLVNNASVLGPSPQPALADYPLDELRRVFEINVVAPLALVQEALTRLAPDARVLNLTSDAAVEPYEGWGGYGSSKAALEQLGNVLGVEEPLVRVYTFDPGDMRTQMHQDAFPGVDISDRPEPETVVPALVRIIESKPTSGRYRAGDVAEVVTT